ncbi:MAG TPA: hypothetical protein VHE35_07100 [Kofleriaceae bacterium]|nr:hypothetical protein [Kofleriaceae bacterium]
MTATARGSWQAIAAGLLAAITLVDCSAGYAAKPAAMVRSSGASGHDEIDARWEQIREARIEAQLDPSPAADATSAMAAVPADEAASACSLPPAPAIGTCHEVCTLGDSICANAVEICRIAGDLEGDAWARDRCDGAKASCREAEDRCCRCRAPDGGAP